MPIRNFHDLEVYQNTYKASLIIHKKVLPNLPKNEKYDLRDQMQRASKAVPRLIAEGYGKRHQKKGFHKYIDDAIAESNEMIVCLDHCIDIYSEELDQELCKKLKRVYDKSSRQLYNLGKSWTDFERQ